MAAVDSKPWVHARAADGLSEMWQGNRPPCWAFKTRDRVMYWDEKERAKYEFRFGQNTMSKYPLAPGELDRILLIENSAGGEPRVGPWLFGTERIVSQSQREVVENGRRWIEFQLVLARGAARQAMLRVDPQTMLPVSLTSRVSENQSPTSVWVFDYPDNGPQDVYALGVPRGVTVDAHLLAADVQHVLDGMAASRDKFGNFHAIVATESNRYALPTYLVWRKQDRWRIDTTSPAEIARCAPFAARGPGLERLVEKAAGASTDLSLVRLRRAQPSIAMPAIPIPNRSPGSPAESIAPPALMSGDRSSGLPDWVRVPHLVYPDLTPQPGWGFEFEPAAADAPGCALLKISANLATTEPMKAHEWYWIDPAKGFAVVRCERFNLPADVPPGPDQFAMGQSLRHGTIPASRGRRLVSGNRARIDRDAAGRKLAAV